jgi:hypothetical protein
LCAGRWSRSVFIGAGYVPRFGVGYQIDNLRGLRLTPDPNDPEITLYDTAVQDPATKEWAQLCAPAPDKTTQAFPLVGTWTPDGHHPNHSKDRTREVVKPPK